MDLEELDVRIVPDRGVKVPVCGCEDTSKDLVDSFNHIKGKLIN